MAHVVGSLVLMADYSWKSNTELCVGDYILGSDLISATVIETHSMIMSNVIRILSTIECPQLQFMESESLWAKDKNRQWWWVENVGLVQRTWKINKKGLKKIDSHLVSYDVEFATLNGFEKRTIVDITENYSSDSNLIFFRTDRCCPVIINGHVASSGLDEFTYDYTKFDWLSSYTQLVQSGKLDIIKNKIV